MKALWQLLLPLYLHNEPICRPCWFSHTTHSTAHLLIRTYSTPSIYTTISSFPSFAHIVQDKDIPVSIYGYGHLCHTIMRSHYFHTTTHAEESSLRHVVMVGSDSGEEYSSLSSGRKGSPQSQIQCGCHWQAQTQVLKA